MIFDDFREDWRGDYDWTHLRRSWRAAIPNAKWVQLTGDEPIFHSFFDIDMKSAVVVAVDVAYGTHPPTYWTIYQDNDPKKRLIVLANVDNDIGESWQWSGRRLRARVTGERDLQAGHQLRDLRADALSNTPQPRLLLASTISPSLRHRHSNPPTTSRSPTGSRPDATRSSPSCTS